MAQCSEYRFHIKNLLFIIIRKFFFRAVGVILCKQGIPQFRFLGGRVGDDVGMQLIAKLRGHIGDPADYRWQAQRGSYMLAATVDKQPFPAHGYQHTERAKIFGYRDCVLQRELVLPANVKDVVVGCKHIHYFLRCIIGHVAGPGIFIALLRHTAIGLQYEYRLVRSFQVHAKGGHFLVGEEYFGQPAIVLYAVHLAPYFYEVATAVDKIIGEVGLQQAEFGIGLIHNMVAVEVEHLVLPHCLVHPLVVVKHIGVWSNDNYFAAGILCLYGFAYCGSHYALTDAASYLKDYFHIVWI